MMKYPVVALVMVSLALVFFAGCPNDFGGAGANFDSSQYYTKTDINSYLGAALPTYANCNNVSATLSAGTTTYGGGASLTGAVPAGAWAVLVKVTNNTGGPSTLFLGDGTNQSSWSIPGTAADTLLLYDLSILTGTPKWYASPSGAIHISGLFYFFNPTTGRP